MRSHTLQSLLLAALSLFHLPLSSASTLKITERAIPTPATIPDPEPDIPIYHRPELSTWFVPNDPTRGGKKREIAPLPQSPPPGNHDPTNINLWICDAPNMTGNCALVNFPTDGYIMRLDGDNGFWGGRIMSMWVEFKGYCEVYAEINPKGSCGGTGGFTIVEYPEGQQNLARELYPGKYFKPGQMPQRPTRAWDHLVRCVKCWKESSKTQ